MRLRAILPGRWSGTFLTTGLLTGVGLAPALAGGYHQKTVTYYHGHHAHAAAVPSVVHQYGAPLVPLQTYYAAPAPTAYGATGWTPLPQAGAPLVYGYAAPAAAPVYGYGYAPTAAAAPVGGAYAASPGSDATVPGSYAAELDGLAKNPRYRQLDAYMAGMGGREMSRVHGLRERLRKKLADLLDGSNPALASAKNVLSDLLMNAARDYLGAQGLGWVVDVLGPTVRELIDEVASEKKPAPKPPEPPADPVKPAITTNGDGGTIQISGQGPFQITITVTGGGQVKPTPAPTPDKPPAPVAPTPAEPDLDGVPLDPRPPATPGGSE